MSSIIPKWIFFKESLKKFKTQGAFLPSTRYLAERMLEPIEMENGIVIVELGAGTGIFTKKILDKMPKDGKLIALDISSEMTNYLRKNIIDNRLIIIQGDATKLSEYLNELGINKIKYIVSGIPLGNFPRELRHNILTAIDQSLTEDGIYMQFQYLMASILHIRKVFDLKIYKYEYRNIPPAFIYKCKKKIKKH